MATLSVALPLEGIVLGTDAGWWRKEVEWCSSSAPMTLSLGGMAQWGLGNRCAKLNWRRAGALFGAMVASMASIVRGFASV
jgi:hypothetical protein